MGLGAKRVLTLLIFSILLIHVSFVSFQGQAGKLQYTEFLRIHFLFEIIYRKENFVYGISKGSANLSQWLLLFI